MSCVNRTIFIDDENKGKIVQDEETNELTLSSHQEAFNNLSSIVGKTVLLRYG